MSKLKIFPCLLVICLIFTFLIPEKQLLAESRYDWSSPNGHYFTQGNRHPLGYSPMGFNVEDRNGVPFWSEFQRLGGVENLGYPISSRWEFQGFVSQAFQKGILQWIPADISASLLNIFDVLHDIGKSDWLAQQKSVPYPLGPKFDADKEWDQIVADRLALMDEFPAIKERYYSVENPLMFFGLPTSEVQDMGNHYSIRLQRTVIQEWKIDVPWAYAGETTIANGGQIFRDVSRDGYFTLEPDGRWLWHGPNLISFFTLEPERPPYGTWDPETFHYEFEAMATWYGDSDHEMVMRNGETFDMYDPTIAAANMFPLGSRLLVTSLNTGVSLVVTVKDTGAFNWPIAIDLSYAAFGEIDDPDRSIIPVNVELLP